MQDDNQLLSRFDKDPGRWRPMYYPLEVSVPIANIAFGEGSININNQPYIWKRTIHGVIGQLDYTTDFSGSGLKDDGMYTIEFKDEQSNYQQIAGRADLMFGSREYWLDMPFPIPYAGNRTLTFRITNRYTRLFVPAASFFIVSVVMHGFADWGSVQWP